MNDDLAIDIISSQILIDKQIGIALKTCDTLANILDSYPVASRLKAKIKRLCRWVDFLASEIQENPDDRNDIQLEILSVVSKIANHVSMLNESTKKH